MSHESQEGPFFNLKVVIKQTGLKPDTLRAWERRYDLPHPQRSSGGHRLYSQRDIETIQWLTARQREGLSIKRAVDLWRQLVAEGQDPLETPAPLAPAEPATPHWAEGETMTELRKGWISACLAYDEQGAEQVLAQAFALYSPETVTLELLQKAVAEIGAGWYRGEVMVQQEHFCSELAIRRLEALIMAAPPPTRSGRILAACPPQEEHIFGLLLLTFLLRRRGWNVVYLGANVPAERLETALAMTKPQLVVMAAQQLHTAATLRHAAEVLRQEGVPLAYGGLVFNRLPALRDRVPGHFLGERLDLAVQTIESRMTAPRTPSPVEAIPGSCLVAREHFGDRRGLIEMQVNQSLHESGIAPLHLAMANRDLALNIDAALALGDMDFLGADIDWVAGLLSTHQIPVETLREYLNVYYEAAETQMDGRGRPIVEWLARFSREEVGSRKE